MESKLSSAAAFVEGGVQDACDDACSICLEPFCDSDPAAVTRCKHDYHLQCILEWCQRSSQCPMCWQPISMKDPMSQELLEVVENERKIRDNRLHVGALFRHPVLGDFEVPVGADDAELEERIIHHLAAAMRRSHRDDRRDGHRRRTGANDSPQILVFSTNEVAPGGSMHASAGQGEDNVQSPAIVFARRFPGLAATEQMRPVGALQLNLGYSDQDAPNLSMYGGRSISRTSENQPAHANQDGAGPSDSQSFSDTLRSRLQSASMKYKDSITKSTRGWRERWFSRSNTMSDLGSEVRREVNAGFAAVARMMERPEATDGTRGPSASSDADNQRVVTPNHAAVNDASSAACASGSGSR